MNLKQMEYFLALSKTGNITHAADTLYLTRQALSNSIKELEHELGTPLFKRNKTGVELTEMGKQVKDFAEQQAMSWQKLVQRAHSLADKKIIKFGTHLMHLDSAKLNAITEFQNAEPDIEFTFYDNEEYTVFWKMLKTGEIDVAMTWKAPESAALSWTKIESYRMFVFVSTENPLATYQRIDFMKDLSGQNCLSVSKDTAEEIASYLKNAGIGHEYVTPNQMLLKRLIKRNSGIYIAPEMAIAPLSGEGIAIKELDNFPVEMSSYLVYKHNPPEHIQRYIEHVTTYKTLMSSAPPPERS